MSEGGTEVNTHQFVRARAFWVLREKNIHTYTHTNMRDATHHFVRMRSSALRSQRENHTHAHTAMVRTSLCVRACVRIQAHFCLAHAETHAMCVCVCVCVSYANIGLECQVQEIESAFDQAIELEMRRRTPDRMSLNSSRSGRRYFAVRVCLGGVCLGALQTEGAQGIAVCVFFFSAGALEPALVAVCVCLRARARVRVYARACACVCVCIRV